MKRRATTRIWALLIAALLIIGLMPMPIFANESGSGSAIHHFAPLDNAVAYQTVPLGTSASSLALPDALLAAYPDDGDSETEAPPTGGELPGSEGELPGDGGDPATGSETPGGNGDNTVDKPEEDNEGEDSPAPGEPTTEEPGDDSLDLGELESSGESATPGEDDSNPSGEDATEAGSDSEPAPDNNSGNNGDSAADANDNSGDGLLHSLALTEPQQIIPDEPSDSGANSTQGDSVGDAPGSTGEETPAAPQPSGNEAGTTYTYRKVPVAGWVSEPSYDANTPGTYVFVPVLAINDNYNPATLPNIIVTVSEEEALPDESGSARRTIRLHKPAGSLRLLDLADGDAGDALSLEARDLYDILSDMEEDAVSATPIPVRETTIPPVALDKAYTDLQLDAVIDQIAEDILQDEIAQPAAEAFWSDHPNAPLLDDEVEVKLDYDITYDPAQGAYLLEVTQVTYLFGVSPFAAGDISVTYMGDPLPIPTGYDEQLAYTIAYLSDLHSEGTITSTDVDELIINITPHGNVYPVGDIDFPVTIKNVSTTGGEFAFKPETTTIFKAPVKLDNITIDLVGQQNEHLAITFTYPLTVAGKVTFHNQLILNDGLILEGGSDLTVDCDTYTYVVQSNNVHVPSGTATLTYNGTVSRIILSPASGSSVTMSGGGILQLDISGHTRNNYFSSTQVILSDNSPSLIDWVANNQLLPVGAFGNRASLVYNTDGYYIHDDSPVVVTWTNSNGTPGKNSYDFLDSQVSTDINALDNSVIDVTIQINESLTYADANTFVLMKPVTITSLEHRNVEVTSGVIFNFFSKVNLENITLHLNSGIVIAQTELHGETLIRTSGVSNYNNASAFIVPASAGNSVNNAVIELTSSFDSFPAISVGQDSTLTVTIPDNAIFEPDRAITLDDGATFSTGKFKGKSGSSLNIGSSAIFTADSVTTDGPLSINGGVIVSDAVKANDSFTVGSAGATIEYTGNNLPASGALDLSNATANVSGDITIKADGFSPSPGAVVVKSNDTITNSLLGSIKLNGAPFDGYVLAYDNTDRVYYLTAVVAVVSHPGNPNGTPYGTFKEAVEAADALAGLSDITITTHKKSEDMPDAVGGYVSAVPTIADVTITPLDPSFKDFQWNPSPQQLVSNVTFSGMAVTLGNDIAVLGSNAAFTLDNGSTLAASSRTISGNNSASFDILGGSSATVNKVTGFAAVKVDGSSSLTVTNEANGATSLAITGSSTMTANTVSAFESVTVNGSGSSLTADTISGTGGTSALTLLGGSAVNAGEISNLAQVSVNGGSNLILNTISVFGTLSTDSNSTLTLRHSPTASSGNGYINLGNTGSITGTLNLAATDTSFAYGDRIVRFDTGYAHSASFNLSDAFGPGSFLRTIAAGADSFYVLTEQVDTITVRSLGASGPASDTVTIEYGGSISVEITLLDNNGAEITNRDGQTIDLMWGDIVLGENLVIANGKATLLLDENHFATLTGVSRLPVTPSGSAHRLSAKFIDGLAPEAYDIPCDDLKVTVEPKLLPIALNGGLTQPVDGLVDDKVYDGEKDAFLKPGVSYADLLAYNVADILDDPADVVIASGQIEFTSKSAGTGKFITVTEITLGGAAKDNYTPLLPTAAIATDASIDQRPVTISARIGKTFDGNKSVSLSHITDLGLENTVSGDILSIDGSSLFEFASPNAANPAPILLDSGAVLDGSDKDNYILVHTTDNIFAQIDPFELSKADIEDYYYLLDDNVTTVTIDPANALTKVYDAGTTHPYGSRIITKLFSGALPVDDVNRDDVHILVGNVQYDSPGVGTGKPLYVELSIDQPAGTENYVWKSGEAPTDLWQGTIEKLGLDTPRSITIEIPRTNPADPMEVPISSLIHHDFGAVPPGEAGNLSFAGSWDWNSGTSEDFFVSGADPIINSNNMLSFSFNESTTLSEMIGKITVSSDNYGDVVVTIKFVVDEGKEGLDIDIDAASAPPEDKLYDAVGYSYDPQLVFTDGSGDPVTDVNWEIAYTTSGGSAVSGLPTDAGQYLLWIMIDDTRYSGSISYPFSIDQRPLAFKPVDREIFLGDAIPDWNVLATDFEEVPDKSAYPDGAGGLVGGQTLADIGMTPPPAAQVVGPVTEAGVYPVQTTAAAYRAQNYTISVDLSPFPGELTVKPVEIDGDSWLEFIFTEGANGWITSDITVKIQSAANPLYRFIGIVFADANGVVTPPAAAGVVSSQTDITGETSGPETAYIYLATDNVDPLTLSAPYEFAYKMDKTKPVVDDHTISQPIGSAVAVLRIEASDAQPGSGVEKVTLELPAGGPVAGPIEMYSTTDGAYEFNIPAEFPDGNYTFYATDFAGHESDRVTIAIDPDDLVKSVDEVTVWYAGTDITDGETEVFLPDDSTLTLQAQTGPDTNAVLGEHYTYEWESDNPAVATVLQNGTGDSSETAVTFHTLGTANITVSAMDKSAGTTFVVSWEEEVDPGDGGNEDDPYVITIRMLSIADTNDRAVIEEMQRLTLQSTDSRILSFLISGFSGSWQSQTEWMDISIRHESGKAVTMPLEEPVTVFLPYPDGVGDSGSSSYMLLHQRSDSELVPLAFTRGTHEGKAGIFFDEVTFSPFSLTWKSGSGGDSGGENPGGNGGGDPDPGPDPGPGPNPGPGDGDGNGNGNGGGGGSSKNKGNTVTSGNNRKYYYDFFWEQVRIAMKQAEPGETVYARVPAEMILCPTSVLQDLYGKDINLYITWQGEDILINGLELFEPDPDSLVYLLAELAELYGISVERPGSGIAEEWLLPENPATGGDDDIAVVLFTAERKVSPAFSMGKPLTIDEQGRVVTAAMLVNPLDPHGLLNGGARQVGFVVILIPCLLISMLVHLLLTRREISAAPVPAFAGAGMGSVPELPQPAPVQAAPAPQPVKAPAPAKPRVPTAAEFEAWVLGADEETYFRLMGQKKRLAAQLAEGSLTKEAYNEQILLLMHSEPEFPAPAPALAGGSGKDLDGIVARHRALKQLYRNGEITREEYLQRKKQLVIRS